MSLAGRLLLQCLGVATLATPAAAPALAAPTGQPMPAAASNPVLLVATAPHVALGTSAPRRPAPLDLWRAADGLFYVDALVNGQTVRFVVDTGASMIVLTAADARRVGAAPIGGAGYRADTAAGAAPMTRVTLGEVEVAGKRAVAVQAAVAPAGLAVSLLGQSWLGYVDSVTIEGDRMTLR